MTLRFQPEPLIEIFLYTPLVPLPQNVSTRKIKLPNTHTIDGHVCFFMFAFS